MSSMRDDILVYVNANLETGFSSTEELPWTKDEKGLYLFNFKYIYVDRPQTTQETLFETLDGSSAVTETLTISVYFATDAKILPSNYDEQVQAIKRGRFYTATLGMTQRTAIVSTEYDGDALVTQIDYSFSKLIID